jgi:glycopeptide antibiotics resistance protein
MEKLNLNFSGGDNVVKSICWIMSYLSWLLLVASGWASIKWLDEKRNIYDFNPFKDDKINYGWTVWVFDAVRTPKGGRDPLENYYPFQMQVSLYYICFILTLIVITCGCVIFFVKTIFKKDDEVINGMMGQFSKFHFFPLLCASALFIIGECVDNDLDDADHEKKMYISGLVFSLIGLASFIFIYIMTDLNTKDWWVLLLLKKGVFSCLIVLMWHCFCYSIFWVHFYDNPVDDKLLDWKKGCGLAFSIIFGVGSLAFSFVFKDIVACGMNLLIYIGLTVAYFRVPKDYRKLKDYNKNGDGIVDIIMIVLSVAIAVLLMIKYREECLKS